MPTGTSMAYVAATGHRPLPTATVAYVRPHTIRPKRAGLDWDALTPTCKTCGAKSGRLNAHGSCPTCTNPAAAAPTPDTTTAPPPPGRRPTTRRTPNTARPARTQPAGIHTATDVTTIRRLYLDQQLSIPQVAEATGHSKGTVRRALLRSNVTLRDDRKTRSGGKKTVLPPEVVADLRRMYIDQGMALHAIASETGRDVKLIRRALLESGVTLRPAAHQHTYHRFDGARTLKQQIADLGVTSREIKDWAIAEGLLLDVGPGIPPARVVTAYTAAHQADVEEQA